MGGVSKCVAGFRARVQWRDEERQGCAKHCSENYESPNWNICSYTHTATNLSAGLDMKANVQTIYRTVRVRNLNAFISNNLREHVLVNPEHPMREVA